MHIIAGSYKNRRLMTPKGMETRPTSGRLREALFNIIQQQITGAGFLDLFAGSGAVGLEALSRGASLSLFVDSSKNAVNCIKENITSLGLEAKTTVYGCTIEKAIPLIERGVAKIDIVYIDPPYQLSFGEAKVPASVYVLNWLGRWEGLAEETMVFVERGSSHLLPLSDCYGSLSRREIRKYGSSELQLYTR